MLDKIESINALEVAFKAQGIEESVKVADLPESTVIAALTYGLRRMIQDHVNSAAFAMCKESGVEKVTPEEARTLVDARLGTLKDGTVGVRGSSGPKAINGLSPELARVLVEYRAKIKSNVDAKAYKAADAKEREAMLVEWMIAQPESMKDRWTKAGAELIAADEEKAKAGEGLF